jgi:hypothetical protein
MSPVDRGETGTELGPPPAIEPTAEIVGELGAVVVVVVA